MDNYKNDDLKKVFKCFVKVVFVAARKKAFKSYEKRVCRNFRPLKKLFTITFKLLRAKLDLITKLLHIKTFHRSLSQKFCTAAVVWCLHMVTV